MPLLIRLAVAAVWLYEGLWCKFLGRLPSQAVLVDSVPRLGPLFGRPFLKTLGGVEVLISLWALSAIKPGFCAVTQIATLVLLNISGLLWARKQIQDPAGMIVKNIAFLVLVWIGGTLPAAQP